MCLKSMRASSKTSRPTNIQEHESSVTGKITVRVGLHHVRRLTDIMLTIHAHNVHNTIITYIAESKHPPMNHHEY